VEVIVVQRWFKQATLARVLPFAAYMRSASSPLPICWSGRVSMLPPAPVSVRILVVVALLYYYRRSYTELWQARLGALAVVAVTGGLLVLVLWINLTPAG
jgi:hypothetical protein